MHKIWQETFSYKTHSTIVLPLLVIFRCRSSMVLLQYFIVVNMVFSYEDKIFIKNLRLSNSNHCWQNFSLLDEMEDQQAVAEILSTSGFSCKNAHSDYFRMHSKAIGYTTFS